MKRKRFSVEHMVVVLNPTHESPGNPEGTVFDNGSAFTSQILDLWEYQHQVKIEFSRPGKPNNAFIELFNGPLRRECLNTQWFLSLANAQNHFDAWWYKSTMRVVLTERYRNKHQNILPNTMRKMTRSLKTNTLEHSPCKWPKKRRPITWAGNKL